MTDTDLAYSVRVAVNGRSLVSIDDYRIRRKGITMLFGESGIGKSLVNRAIAGLLGPDEFDFEVNGVQGPEYVHSPSTQDALSRGFFVFQEPSTHLHPLLTIGEQLREGSLGGDADETKILSELWAGPSSSFPENLLQIYPKPFRPSGGEKQRILLAMAFKKIDQWIAASPDSPPPMFVFDEPTGSLDNRFRDVVLHMLFARYRQRPFTAVVISHDYSMVNMIRRAHPDLHSSIAYRELSLDSTNLTLRPFEPETYLHWLGEQRTPSSQSGAAEFVGRVEGALSVFGRRLRISSDPGGTIPVPLLLRKGSMVYVKAPSGMGKTTLAKVMMGLLPADHFQMGIGETVINEKTEEGIWRRLLWGRKMTMVFQHADEALNPQSTVSGSFQGLPLVSAHTKPAILEFLEHLFSAEVARTIYKKKVSNLSGGQKQRLNLLRGIALHTDVLILDEPLNGLDFESAVRVLAMLRERLEHGSTILVISHNEEIFDSQVRPEDVYHLGEIQEEEYAAA